MGCETQVDVLCTKDGPLANFLVQEAETFHHCQPLTPATDVPFSYHAYPLIITVPERFCLELARMGLVFVTLALTKEQLNTAYALEQLGVSITLGWQGSKKSDAIQQCLADLMVDQKRRQQHSRSAMQVVDGKALERLASFVPAEKAPTQEPLPEM